MEVDMELPPKPEHIHNLEFVRILTPYIFARRLVLGKSVLDVGCGLGYGDWLLAISGGERIVALDIEQSKVRRVASFRGHFQNLYGLVMNAQDLAFGDHTFQVITCFEVIEHVPKPHLLLSGLRRVLKRDGVLLLTTPNRALRLLPFQRPWNSEHLREYTLKALRGELGRYFPSVAVLGISGEPEHYGFYRRMWQQSPLRVYGGWALRIIRFLTPGLPRRWIRRHLGQAIAARSSGSEKDLLNMAIPVPDPMEWPFYISDTDDHCLGFFSVCGFDDHSVEDALGMIRR
jgi:ubiquinone/menaquinone biosynthesis C-methylase UbiE